MYTLLREHKDHAYIRGRLVKLSRHLVAGVVSKNILPNSSATVARWIAQAIDTGDPFDVYVMGPCIVGCGVAKPWWSEDSFLSEEFIIRYKNGDFKETIKDLERLAQAQGCIQIVVSSLAAQRMETYGRYLNIHGFKQVSGEYVKEVHG